MKTLRHETFIALRARRQALQIAQDILNPSLDLKQVYCRACGRYLRTDRLDAGDRIPCHLCGHENVVPHELAERIRASIPVASEATASRGWWEDLPAARPPSTIRAIAWLMLLVMLFVATYLLAAMHSVR